MEKYEIDADPNATPSSDATEWETPEFAVMDISKATKGSTGTGGDGGGFTDSFSSDDHS